MTVGESGCNAKAIQQLYDRCIVSTRAFVRDGYGVSLLNRVLYMAWNRFPLLRTDVEPTMPNWDDGSIRIHCPADFLDSHIGLESVLAKQYDKIITSFDSIFQVRMPIAARFKRHINEWFEVMLFESGEHEKRKRAAV